MKRQKRVKQKLQKIREQRVQQKKYEKETARLQRQTAKISDKEISRSTRLFNPSHSPGNFVRSFNDISQQTVVQYSYMGKTVYAEIKSNNLMLILHESEVKDFSVAKFKNGQMKLTKSLDNADTEVIMA
jgi:hypothetical protein